MGYSLSWVAVAPSAEPKLFELLGLSQGEETADSAEFDLSGARLSEWYLLVADRKDALVDQSFLQELSQHGRVIAAMVEEHVMFACAEEWANGERVWGVVHMSEVDLYHIAAEGALPQAYASIRQEQFDKQEAEGGKDAGVDHIIDIPLDLASDITGYRHDNLSGLNFVELKATNRLRNAKQQPIDGVSCDRGVDKRMSSWYQQEPSAKPGLFSRLFGKR